MKQLSTKERALREGRALLQQHGYNGFSFQDIANRLGIQKPSLYDHFSSKEELILAIIERYGESFEKWSSAVADLKPLDKIQKAFDLFYTFTSDHQKVCPILALSADAEAPSSRIEKSMHAFVDHWLDWLSQQIKEGQKDGSIRKDMDASSLASFIYSQAMGAQAQARLKKNAKVTLQAGEMIVKLIRRTK